LLLLSQSKQSQQTQNCVIMRYKDYVAFSDLTSQQWHLSPLWGSHFHRTRQMSSGFKKRFSHHTR